MFPWFILRREHSPAVLTATQTLQRCARAWEPERKLKNLFSLLQKRNTKSKQTAKAVTNDVILVVAAVLSILRLKRVDLKHASFSSDFYKTCDCEMGTHGSHLHCKKEIYFSLVDPSCASHLAFRIWETEQQIRRKCLAVFKARK